MSGELLMNDGELVLREHENEQRGSGTGFGLSWIMSVSPSMLSKPQEKAARIFVRAGNAFKAVAKLDFATQQCNNAGADAANAFFRAATLFEQIQMAEEARTTFEDCARAHFKISALLGENILVTKVIPHHVASGNFARAAKFHNEIAENLENAHEFAKAITHFLEAAKFFAIETAPTLELIALRRVAALYVQLDPPQFGDAAKTFSICARNAAARPLTAMSASQDAAYATLCALAHDPESAFNLDLNAEFNKPPAGICVYVARIARAVQERNADAFEAAVFAFSAVFGGTSPDWTKNALQRIRSRIAD